MLSASGKGLVRVAQETSARLGLFRYLVKEMGGCLADQGRERMQRWGQEVEAAGVKSQPWNKSDMYRRSTEDSWGDGRVVKSLAAIAKDQVRCLVPVW